MATESKCPVDHGSVGVGQQNDDWWPNQLNLRVLPHGTAGASPMGDDFDYATEFDSLDLAAVKADLVALMTDSQEWWPGYGHYGPFFVRMAWHRASTYRTSDGRGRGRGHAALRSVELLAGQRRLTRPDGCCGHQGRRPQLSWGDLFILTGNVAMGHGIPNVWFGGGRADVYEPDITYARKPSGWPMSATPVTATWRTLSPRFRWA